VSENIEKGYEFYDKHEHFEYSMKSRNHYEYSVTNMFSEK
jgi:hypothetical protein